MKIRTSQPTTALEPLDAAAAARVAGGMLPLYDDGTGDKSRPGAPPEGSFGGGLDQWYWDSAESMRFGAGPWDYGYGSPTGPWP